MAAYSIFLKKSAARELETFPKRDLARIIERIRSLADDPRPPGAEKLSGQERYLPRLTTGGELAAYALTESGSGSDSGSKRSDPFPSVGARKASIFRPPPVTRTRPIRSCATRAISATRVCLRQAGHA